MLSWKAGVAIDSPQVCGSGCDFLGSFVAGVVPRVVDVSDSTIIVIDLV